MARQAAMGVLAAPVLLVAAASAFASSRITISVLLRLRAAEIRWGALAATASALPVGTPEMVATVDSAAMVGPLSAAMAVMAAPAAQPRSLVAQVAQAEVAEVPSAASVPMAAPAR